MNRELKFRVWDLAKNQWFDLENSLCFVLNPNKTDLSFITPNGPYKIPETPQEHGGMNRFVVVEYTGLKDKNGKEIYEGDIIQYNRRSSYDGINFVVQWSEDKLGFIFKSKTGEVLVNERTPEGNRFSHIEVVGNIFQPPCKPDHNGECLVCDNWLSDCEFANEK